MTEKRMRANGEGSIYPYRNGFAAYVWVDTPDGKRKRKYVYGKTRDIVHDKWIKLHADSKKGPVPTSTPTLAAYLDDWIREVVRPGLKPKTADTYAMHVRLYLVPGLGTKRIDKLRVRDVREWINKLMDSCQCCAQGKDAARPVPRCCAIGKCCGSKLSRRVVMDARAVLRSALTNAMTEELISKNVAALTKVRPVRRTHRKPWTVEEARTFLESARTSQDPFYAAYVLILVLGLRRGEALGLAWSSVDLDGAVLQVENQLQRIGGRLVHDETKTEASEAPLPLPAICVSALRLRQTAQDAARGNAGQEWNVLGLVFTTGTGEPIDPRNFNRSFDRRCLRAGVRKVRLHDTRHTCGTLLAALDVHPRIAMQILRHSKIAVTMEIYTHAPSAKTVEALKRLGEYLEDRES